MLIVKAYLCMRT